MLNTIGNPILLDSYILKLKLYYDGHAARANGPERAMMNGIVEGSMRWRPKTRQTDEINKALEMTTANRPHNKDFSR